MPPSNNAQKLSGADNDLAARKRDSGPTRHDVALIWGVVHIVMQDVVGNSDLLSRIPDGNIRIRPDRKGPFLRGIKPYERAGFVDINSTNRRNDMRFFTTPSAYSSGKRVSTSAIPLGTCMKEAPSRLPLTIWRDVSPPVLRWQDGHRRDRNAQFFPTVPSL
jgi:hypothetical protein